MSPELRRSNLEAVALDGSNVAMRLAVQHGVTRQAASAWLGRLKKCGKLAGTRRYVFPRYPFSLIYRVAHGVMTVVAVAHQRRKPGCWVERH
jgi:plasmid stabilization system protein ParE